MLFAYSLPDGIGPQAVRHFLIAAGLVCIALAVFAVRLIGRVGLRLSLAAALVVLGFVLFVERAQLSSCAQSCTCEVLTLSVQVPGCQPQ